MSVRKAGSVGWHLGPGTCVVSAVTSDVKMSACREKVWEKAIFRPCRGEFRVLEWGGGGGCVWMLCTVTPRIRWLAQRIFPPYEVWGVPKEGGGGSVPPGPPPPWIRPCKSIGCSIATTNHRAILYTYSYQFSSNAMVIISGFKIHARQG